MILISEAPADLQRLENGYPQNSMERLLLQTMSENSENLEFDSEEELDFELKLRAATVKAAKELYHSGMAFAVFRKSKCNSDFWNRSNEGGFILKEGANAADAIRDIYENGSKYATECATAIMIVFYKAILEVYPDALFNQTFQEIELMNWHHIDPILKSLGIMTNTTYYLPGDRRYFMNPDVNPLTPEWQGENVIMLNTDSYYGHGIGIQDEATMIKKLNRNRIKDAEEPAYLMKTVSRPDYRKLWKIKKQYHEE